MTEVKVSDPWNGSDSYVPEPSGSQAVMCGTDKAEQKDMQAGMECALAMLDPLLGDEMRVRSRVGAFDAPPVPQPRAYSASSR